MEHNNANIANNAFMDIYASAIENCDNVDYFETTYTHEQLATLALSENSTFNIALENIRRDTRKMARATYSSGTFGKRWRIAIEKIMKYHDIKIELNNKDYTRIGIYIIKQLEKLGYSYNYNYTEFTKTK